MSRITTHCVCLNHEEHVDTLSKVYSILPNYFGKPECNSQSPELCTNNLNIPKTQKCSRINECNMCTNYENIGHFISGTFRPRSCPADENDGCVQTEGIRNNPLATLDNRKCNRKGSRSSMKHDKHGFHDQIYISKNVNNSGTSQRLDTIHQGLNFYVNKSGLPVIAGNVPETLIKHDHHGYHRESNTFLTNPSKKPSCGLKYIFQKLSIMTHFLTKSKDKSSSLALDKKQLSDENLFKDNKGNTKRSKSFHTIEPKESFIFDKTRGPSNKQVKQRLYATKGSDTSNSSTGSIDAHAGSPITIMSTACGNFLGALSDPFISNAFSHVPETTVRNDCHHPYTSPEKIECPRKKGHHQVKHAINKSHGETPSICMAHQNYSYPTCLHPFQQPCHPMLYEPVYPSHYHTQSSIQPQYPSYHCCHLNSPHFCMYPPLSQYQSSCCQPSNHFCHCSIVPRACIHQQNLCQYETRLRSNLCQSCHYRKTKRCQSETLDNNQRNSEQSNQILSNSNVRYKFKSEMKSRASKLSPSNHSKSIASTIPPPPPPPPPSSLYSANEPSTHKIKHKKHGHNKIGKLCTNCNVVIPHMIHSSDCTNNVQNIIYSHLNNNSTCNNDSKAPQDFLPQNSDVLYACESPINNNRVNTKQDSFNEMVKEGSDNDCEVESHKFCPSKRRVTEYNNHNDVLDRRSAEMLRQNASNYKPKFLSKTPETYKNKNERRHKKHQCETQRISKHKSISTTREYKFIDNDSLYREDSMDSPEAGSFIYHPISPLVQKNSQSVFPKKVSSYNNRLLCNYNDTSYGKPELVRKAFQENMLSLREVGWYWGPLSFTEAESLMENKANGTFLVRDSGHDTYFLSLTFRVRETTYHTRIEYSQGTFSFWSQPESHSATTIVEFIDKAVAHSQSGKFHYFLLTNVPGQPPMEVSLLYPLSRRQIVHSLKHLSRFVILSNIRKDHIADLSVPPALRIYLLEKQYYISNLEEFINMTLDSHPLSYKPSTVN